MREGLSRVRNRVLARVFNELGLNEQWGTGVRRTIDACTRAGLPEPEFAEVGLRFRVTLRTEPIGPLIVDAVEKRIVDYIAEGDGRSTAAIAQHVGLSTRSTQHRLASLEQRGLIAVVGSGPRDPRRRWHSARKPAAP
jgi:predicted HTH transcriptional regulator